MSLKALDTFPMIESNRLILRQTDIKDAEAMYDIFSDEEQWNSMACYHSHL